MTVKTYSYSIIINEELNNHREDSNCSDIEYNEDNVLWYEKYELLIYIIIKLVIILILYLLINI